MAEVSVDRGDIERLAHKLDTLGKELNSEEKTLLLAVFRLAGEALSEQTGEDVAGIVKGNKAGVLTLNSEGRLPSLSSGFKDAFTAGGASGGEDLTSAISVDGSVSVMGTTKEA
jgi:hypothetical protein